MNLTGTLQKTMVDKQVYQKGQHQFHFTKGDIPAGVYQLVFEEDGIILKTEVFICCNGLGWLEIKNQLKLGLKLVLVFMLSVVGCTDNCFGQTSGIKVKV